MSMLSTSWAILCDTAVYILIGFVVAGLLQAWMSGGKAMQWLSKRRPRSVILATLVGAPLPLCSCGVLPSAVTLRRGGASRGATLSFLISTPETSVTSIFLTYSLLGMLMAVFRPIAAVITALTAGFIENFFDRREAARDDETDSKPTADDQPTPSCCCSSKPDASEDAKQSRMTVREGMNFAFADLFDSIFHWIIIGIVAAAAIQIFLPAGLISQYVSDPWLAMLLMLVIGIPLYLCAEASTPIAAALIAQGLNPGAALILLLAGPATNIGAVGLLSRELGKRTVVVYLATIAVMSLLMGYILNLIVGAESISLNLRTFEEPLLPAWLKTAGAIVFLALGVHTMRRRRWLPRLVESLNRGLPVNLTPGRALTLLIILALIAYGASGFYSVQPGEEGVVRRFGRITRTDVEPGLHYCWPYPIEQADRIPVERVNRLILGYAPAPAAPDGAVVDEDQEADAWVLLGDENIADLRCAVHWGAKPDQTLLYAYSTYDQEKLVAAAALSAMREVLGGRSINHGFTTERFECEQLIEALIRERLDEYRSGIRVDSFCFLDAHAPADVHDSFRDVASALEDKSTQINLARARKERILPLARGEASRLEAEAEGYAALTTSLAAGEADRFTALLEDYRAFPRILRWRLYMETLESVLPDMRLYLKPGDADAQNIEIWLLDSKSNGGLPWQDDDLR